MRRLILCIAFFLSASLPTFLMPLQAQVTSYPHVESFEASNGGWASGGALSTWAWGIPADLVINTAGHGMRVWTTGLAIPYNANERSTLTSPLFDMSSLSGPMVSFMLFREIEPGWDGVGFQYSTDGGTTWADFPTTGANCFRSNWYTHASITYNDFPANNPGWGGNATNIAGGGCSNGGGTGAWQTVTHCLNNLPADLAGRPNVRFRFTFGAGGICQDDGAAIDLFSVVESPVAADFTAVCLGAREVEFEASSTLPGCVPTFPGWSFDWDFGDPLSGIDNVATGWSASHIFTADGTYTVTLTATNPCGNSITVSDVVYVDMATCLLPTTAASLSVTAGEEQAVLLRWEASLGSAQEELVVQRSTDGRHWEHLCAHASGSEPQGMQKGTCMDLNPPAGDVLYRLAMPDDRGGLRTLALAEWQGDEAGLLDLRVAPHPAHAGQMLQLQLLGQIPLEGTVTIRNLMGQPVASQHMTPDLLDGNLLHLQAPAISGSYWVELSTSSQRVTTRLQVF